MFSSFFRVQYSVCIFLSFVRSNWITVTVTTTTATKNSRADPRDEWGSLPLFGIHQYQNHSLFFLAFVMIWMIQLTKNGCTHWHIIQMKWTQLSLFYVCDRTQKYIVASCEPMRYRQTYGNYMYERQNACECVWVYEWTNERTNERTNTRTGEATTERTNETLSI